MRVVRGIWEDLVEKRLWPVAVALVAALFVVPILLKGGDDAAAPAPIPVPKATAATAGDTGATALVSLGAAPTGPQNRRGAVRNPFVQHHIAKPVPPVSPDSTSTKPSSTTPLKTDTSNGGSLPTLTDSNPVTTPPDSGGSTPTPKKDTPASPNDTWHVNLRFGQAGDQKLIHDVPRLTPLPSSTDPFFVFLGVLSDGKTAVFLVSSDAAATGDGVCKPSPTDCETIEMQAGDTEFFDVTQGTAGVAQYELDLLTISHSAAKSASAAAAIRAHESRGGREVLREAIADGMPALDGYRYSSTRGVLLRKGGLVAGTLSNMPRLSKTSSVRGAGSISAG